MNKNLNLKKFGNIEKYLNAKVGSLNFCIHINNGICIELKNLDIVLKKDSKNHAIISSNWRDIEIKWEFKKIMKV